MDGKVKHQWALRALSLVFVWTATVFSAKAMPLQSYYAFDNLGGVTQNLCVRSIAQSSDGMIWLAAESGLYSYDGHRLVKREMEASVVGKQDIGSLNCLLENGDSLIIGCDKGLLSFNLNTYRYKWLSYAKDERIKDIVRTNSSIWVASERIIYENGSPLEPCPENIVSLYGCDEYLYIGTSNSIYGYSVKQRQLEKISSGIAFASCFFSNPSEGTFWVGSANSVAKWSKVNKKSTFNFAVPVGKSLYPDKNGNMLIGTDNGLYVVGKDGSVHVLLHDARRENSLAGDAVWCIFRDRSNNTWIGTNSGVSLIPGEGILSTFYLTSITGESSGNQFFCAYQDSKNRYWLGGSNGLLCIENLGKNNQSFRWYRMNDKRYPLPHNRLRDILEAENGTIFIGGDMGLMMYDEASRQFQRYTIEKDPFNWVYDIRHSKGSELILTTFSATYLVKLDHLSHRAVVKKTLQRELLSTLTLDKKALLDKYGLAESYLSAFYEPSKGKLLLGGTDRFSILDTKRLTNVRKDRNLTITDIRVNDERYVEHEQIRQADVTLLPSEKVMEILFTDFVFSGEPSPKYLYRIDDGAWMPVQASNSSIMLTNLKPGKYLLSIRFADSLQGAIDLKIRVKAPWFATPLAKVLYLIFLGVLMYGIYYFFQQRKRSKLEREEHQALMLQARKKESELLSDKEYLANQLRLQLLAKAGADGVLSEDEKFLVKITKIIEENLSDFELNVNTLCALSDVGSKQMYRKIKAMTGMTTVAYIRDQRMKKAATLLSKGTFTVSEVMYMVGFSNPSYFSRCFTEEYGIPPSEYNV